MTLAELIDSRFRTRGDFAIASGVREYRLSRLTNGRDEAGERDIARMAAALGVTAEAVRAASAESVAERIRKAVPMASGGEGGGR